MREASGADEAVAFVEANPMDEAHRSTNPLGKVPALVMTGGPRLFETTLICRTLMALGGRDLLPTGDARLAAEADVALLMGVLDLGVAFRLESLRPSGEQSPAWQERRLAGIRAALPFVEEAAGRADPEASPYAAFALVATCDWLDFRLAPDIAWRDVCPNAAARTDALLRRPDFVATDPRA